MKRFAYTLSEVLITLAIIGVVSAMVTPAVTNLMPDKKKSVVLKKYAELSKITQEVLSDTRYYKQDEANPLNRCIGLACTTQADNSVIPQGAVATNWEGVRKYAFVMQEILGGTFERHIAARLQFTTDDGVLYGISHTLNTNRQNMHGGQTSTATATIILLLPEESFDGEAATFSANNQNPRMFEFDVDTYGNITGRDPLTRAYLMNPDKLNNKAKDLAQANKFLQ